MDQEAKDKIAKEVSKIEMLLCQSLEEEGNVAKVELAMTKAHLLWKVMVEEHGATPES